MRMPRTGKGLAMTLAALSLTVGASAIPRGPCDEMPNVCCEEPASGPFAFSYGFDQQLACGRDFYAYASFLLLQAKEDGLEYGIENARFSTAGRNFPVQGGKVKGFSSNSSDWDWNPGFRAGIGFISNHDLWVFGIDFTYLHISNSTDSAVIDGTGIIPIWLTPNQAIFNNTLSSASAMWKAKLFTMDGNIGNPLYTSRYLVLKPHFGFRVAMIDQFYAARYTGQFSSDNSEGLKVSNKNDFWGVGPRAGLETRWLLGYGFELIGKMSGSLLFGSFDIRQETPLSDSPATGYTVKNNFYTNKPNAEIQLGLFWGHYLHNKSRYVSLEVLWEMHQWWQQNQMRRFFDSNSTISTDTISRGHLTMNGVSFRLRFDI